MKRRGPDTMANEGQRRLVLGRRILRARQGVLVLLIQSLPFAVRDLVAIFKESKRAQIVNACNVAGAALI